jgi:hypothetical protein
MAAVRATYRALRVIYFNEVRAYNPGDPVDVDAVEGPGAWLVLGEDVEAHGDIPVSTPAVNASQAAWAAYAVTQRGADADEAAGMSRAELVKAYG